MAQRVEKHIIKSTNEYYKMLDDFCFKSKNLYNFANYKIRQEFINNGKYLNYYDIDKLCKMENEDFDYRNMPTAQSAQQTLRLLDKNWKSFFKSIKKWSKDKNSFLGRPKLPKYKKKDGRNILILTNCECKVKDGKIKFPKAFNGFELTTKCKSIQQIKIIPRCNHIVVEVIYNKSIEELKEDNGRYVSIDLGVDNLMALTNNCNVDFKIISGILIKSRNQSYNKQRAYYTELAKRINDVHYTKRLNKLDLKRNNIINDLIHKASKKAVEYAIECNANVIVIGLNKEWKQDSDMGKKANQKFVQIPYNSLIQKIKYKAEEQGITVITTEESYTSGTSFLDNESPIKENYNKNRRIKRGLFKSNKGKLINSDINGSLQILKKVFPNAYKCYGIEDLGYSPIRVNL